MSECVCKEALQMQGMWEEAPGRHGEGRRQMTQCVCGSGDGGLAALPISHFAGGSPRTEESLRPTA